MGSYAKDTDVPVAASKSEIERTLTRYGATEFLQGWRDGVAYLAFTIKRRPIRIIVPMPKRDEFLRTENRRLARSEAQIDAAWEKAQRQKWRALLLVVKAKLEAVESGISTIDDEFLAWTLLPSGETVREWIEPQLDRVISAGQMPALLPSGRD